MQYLIVNLESKNVMRRFLQEDGQSFTYNINLAGKFSADFVSKRGIKIFNKSNKKLINEEKLLALQEIYLPFLGRKAEVIIKK